MYVLDFLKSIVKECSRVISFGAKIQARERDELVSSLENICNNCHTAFTTVKERLLPIKQSYGNTASLANELREFAADSNTRDAFKPYKLCGEVDSLLSNLESNLDLLKYSISVQKIKLLKKNLQDMGNFDYTIFEEYDDFTSELDRYANKIEVSGEESNNLVKYIQEVIAEFEEDLSLTIQEVQQAKDRIIR